MFSLIITLGIETQQLQIFLLGLFTGIVFMLLIFYILSIRRLNKQYENILTQFQYTKSQLMKTQSSQNPISNPNPQVQQTQISITKEEVKENKSLLSILVEKALTTSKITLGGEITLDLGDEEIEIGGKKYKAKGSLSFNINQPTSQPTTTQFDESIVTDEKEKIRMDSIKKLLKRK
jgi:hypothetical protein